VLAVYQAGSLGATGLVMRASSDLGQTWEAESQISSRQDVLPAGAMNRGTGDVHLVYSRPGDPALSSAWGVWYRVLVWNGSGWAATGEAVVEAGSASQGLSNAVVDVDSNGYLAAAFYKKTATQAVMRALASNAPFDLSSATASDAMAAAVGAQPIQPVLRFLPGVEWWGLLFELDGFVRISRSATVLSPTQHLLAWVAAQTFFVTPTPAAPLDAAWNPDPDDAPNGRLGIAYVEGGTAKFRTWEAQTNALGAAQTVAAQAASQAVSRYFGQWIVGWTETVSGDQRKLRISYTSDLSTRYDLDTDPGASAWRGLRLGRDVSDYNCLVLQWAEGVDPGLDGYTVYLASVAVAIFKNVADTSAALEALVAGPMVSDSATAVDVVPTAGEARSVSDSASASDSVGPIGRSALDAASAAESFAFTVGSAASEEAIGADMVLVTVDVFVDDSGMAADVTISGVPVPVSESGSVSEVLDMVKQILSEPQTVGDLSAVAAERLSLTVLLPEAVRGEDSVRAGPDVSDSGSAAEAFALDLRFSDRAAALETFGVLGSYADQAQNRVRYAIMAAAGGLVDVHSGVRDSWEARGPVQDEARTRLFAFEDLDVSYKGVVFACTPTGPTAWGPLMRSGDGGRAFAPAGPPQMACIALAAGGSLYGVGNDGGRPASPDPLGHADGVGPRGWAVVQRQVFRSADRGLTWGRVMDDQAYGTGGSYPSYAHVVCDPDDPLRVAALGVARGSRFSDELQVAASRDGGQSWSVALPAVGQVSHYPGPGALHTDSVTVGAAGGRLVFGGTRADVRIGSDFSNGNSFIISFPTPGGSSPSTQTAVAAGATSTGRKWGITADGWFSYGPNISQYHHLTGASVVTAVGNDTHVFVVDSGAPATVTAIQISTEPVGVAGTLALGAGEDHPSSAVLVGSYLYLAFLKTPGTIVKVDVSDPTAMVRDGGLTLDAGEAEPSGLSASGSFLYAVTRTAPARIVKVDISGPLPTRDSALTLDSGEDAGTPGCAVSGEGTALFVTVYPGSGDSKLVKVGISGPMARLGAVSVPGFVSAVAAYQDAAYVLYPGGGYTNSGLRKYDCFSNTPTFVSASPSVAATSHALEIVGGLILIPSYPAVGNVTPPRTYGFVAFYNVTGSSIGVHQPGPATLWTSDDSGATWAVAQQYGDGAPFVDATRRGSSIYAVRRDPSFLARSARILLSQSEGQGWRTLQDVGDPIDPYRPSLLSAVAYDHRSRALYVGLQNDSAPAWRMDDPPDGAWTDIRENLAAATGDQTPTVSLRGLGILSVILSIIDIASSDSGGASEGLAVSIALAESAVAVDRPGVNSVAGDSASASEALSVAVTSSLTVRLLMHYGRVRLRMEGTNEPAVPSNPAG
jgi:hypothetical protein